MVTNFLEKHSTTVYTYILQNVRCHNLQDHNIKFVATGIWNFMYYCRFIPDEPAVSSVRGTSCWVPFRGLHMRRMQGELVPCRCYVGARSSWDSLDVQTLCVLTWLCLRCELVTMVKVKADVLWSVTQCGLVKDCWRFGGIYGFHLQSNYISDYTKTHNSQNNCLSSPVQQFYRRHKNMADPQRTDTSVYYDCTEICG